MKNENVKTNFKIDNLGECKFKSPIKLSNLMDDAISNYVSNYDAVRNSVNVHFDNIIPTSSNEDTAILDGNKLKQNPWTDFFEKAGARENIYFNPSEVHAGIVSCGGLCPGINDVIRALVRCLWIRYGVKKISGIQYGYQGLIASNKIETRSLHPDTVDTVHTIGGTFLGTSRGGGDKIPSIVDTIERLKINILFTIGGDGTQKGLAGIADEVEKRKLKISLIGIPKTIDNDLLFIDRSFGFETAITKAAEIVNAAHIEAKSVLNGIGLVKLMGRESGFIALHTVLAAHEANFVLIPELRFEMNGPNGFLFHLEKRILERAHAVIVVAEGAGQEFFNKDPENIKKDASGNVKLGDIGIYIKEKITNHFNSKGIEFSIKYFDPGYIIRSSRAVPTDSVYCERLGNNAVHAAMAGKTRLLIGMVHNHFVHIPIEVAVSKRNKVDPEGDLWRDAIDSTLQTPHMLN